MKEYFLPKTGICFRVNDFQAGRKTLVFIHGLTGSASSWFEYEGLLGEDYNILSTDLRGHGKSFRPDNYRDCEIKNFAEDVYDLIVTLGLRQIVLISHSFGTLVALEFLLKHPDKAEAAVFLSPSFGVKKTLAAKVIKAAVAILAFVASLFPVFKKLGGRVDYSKYQNVGDWDAKLNLADIRNTGWRTCLWCLKQIYSSETDNFWSQIALPSLIIHGRQDSVIPFQNAVVMPQKIKGSKLILLDQANHLFVLNNAAAVCKIVRNFVIIPDR